MTSFHRKQNDQVEYANLFFINFQIILSYKTDIVYVLQKRNHSSCSETIAHHTQSQKPLGLGSNSIHVLVPCSGSALQLQSNKQVAFPTNIKIYQYGNKFPGAMFLLSTHFKRVSTDSSRPCVLVILVGQKKKVHSSLKFGQIDLFFIDFVSNSLFLDMFV